VTVSGDQTLYAKWTVNTYTITFDTQGGTTTDSVTKSVTYGSTYGDFPEVEREGYMFAGWWTGTDSESIGVTSTSEVTVTDDQKLYAKWILTYTVTFDTQGGTTTDSVTMSVIYGSTYGDLPTAVREGYYFGGWWTGTDSVSEQVTSSSEVTVADDQTLYANWIATGVGLIGPAGGYVFYDKGSYGDDGWRYLEAAPYGWYDGGEDPKKDWGAYGYTVNPSATDTIIGTGEANTANIVTYHDSLETLYPEKGDYYTNASTYCLYNHGTVAAKVCSEYSVECNDQMYDDWFLPSQEELTQMYINLYKNGLGGFECSVYWSSSEFSSEAAYYQKFEYQTEPKKVYKTYLGRVRPVRAF
jgi:uncharacterized repeat protein (TIGR02543 family)